MQKIMLLFDRIIILRPPTTKTGLSKISLSSESKPIIENIDNQTLSLCMNSLGDKRREVEPHRQL
jgi:hypothetical protein